MDLCMTIFSCLGKRKQIRLQECPCSLLNLAKILTFYFNSTVITAQRRGCNSVETKLLNADHFPANSIDIAALEEDE